MNGILLMCCALFFRFPPVQASQGLLGDDAPDRARSYVSLPSVDPVMRTSSVRGADSSGAPEQSIEVIRALPIQAARVARVAAQKKYQESLPPLEKTLSAFSHFQEDGLKAFLQRMGQEPALAPRPGPPVLREAVACHMLEEVMLHLRGIGCRKKAILEILRSSPQQKREKEAALELLQAHGYRLFSYRNRLRRILGKEDFAQPPALPSDPLWDRLQALKNDLDKTRRAHKIWMAAEESYKDAMFPGAASDLHRKPILRIRSHDLSSHTGERDVLLLPPV